MNTGKTLFAQLMDFLPWTTFTRIVDRYWAQLTYRESLRDIETCLSVHAYRSHGLPPAGPASSADLPAKA